MLSHVLAAIFLLIAMYFVWRSFYRMRIGGREAEAEAETAKTPAYSNMS